MGVGLPDNDHIDQQRQEPSILCGISSLISFKIYGKLVSKHILALNGVHYFLHFTYLILIILTLVI
jgi:hypothetical protein